MSANFIRTFYKDESGQGITEYGAVLAFVAFLITATLALGRGAMGLAIKNSFSTTASVLSQIATSAS